MIEEIIGYFLLVEIFITWAVIPIITCLIIFVTFRDMLKRKTIGE